MKPQRHSISSINIGVVGATGLVGREFLSLMEERNFPVKDLYLFASDKSIGKRMKFRGRQYKVLPFSKEIFRNIHMAFFSAGADIDMKLVPKAAAQGTICIDNSSAFRMNRNIPLIVPEINFNRIKKTNRIIANPNCSTIQLVLVLDILRKLYSIKSVCVSTYQAVSGAGRESLELYLKQSSKQMRSGNPQFFDNIIQRIGQIDENGYCEEEMKIVNETKKILNDRSIQISPTAMRVPLSNVHTESVIVSFKEKISLKRIKNAFDKNTNNVLLVNELDSCDASRSNITFVSRLRRDLHSADKLLMIISADNLRVGAALNGIRIAERILNEK
ncbi:MAG: aspartate-semialdehyde dehydrogenase [bacterium]